MKLDKELQEGGNEVFTDDTYEEYEREMDEIDSKLSDLPIIADAGASEALLYKDPDDWEDVE